MSVDDVIVVEPTDRGGWKERRKGERQREGGRDQRWRLAKAGGSGRGGSGGGNGDGLVVGLYVAPAFLLLLQLLPPPPFSLELLYW